MEYITEINMFFDWLESNPMKASSIVLWFALMDTANKARWSMDFSVAISTLRSKTGCTKDQIYAARNQLQQKGRISFRQRPGNQSSIYRIIPFASDIATQTPTQKKFVSEIATQIPTQEKFASDIATQIPTQMAPNNFVSEIATQSSTQTSTQSPTQTPNIIRLYKTETRHHHDDGGAHERKEKMVESVSVQNLFSRYFGRVPLPAERETCERWLRWKNPELVEYAFYQATAAQETNLRYVSGILKKIEERGIHDMGDLAEYDMRREKRM